MFIMISGPLSCCSSLVIVSLTPLICNENLICPEPEIRESQIANRNGLELPFYTASFV